MIEDSKVVKKVVAKTGGMSGTYWTVTWEDDKSDNVFNPDWLPLLEQSQSDGRPVHFTKEKSGKYYNIKTLELLDTIVEKEEKGEIQTGETKSGIAPQEKGMWWKHKAFALSYAKDLLCAGIIEREELYRCAEEMMEWLNKNQ